MKRCSDTRHPLIGVFSTRFIVGSLLAAYAGVATGGWAAVRGEGGERQQEVRMALATAVHTFTTEGCSSSFP